MKRSLLPRTKTLLIFLIHPLVLVSALFAQDAEIQLFIHGGGGISSASDEVLAEMAGGENGKLVVIPTATSDERLPNQSETERTWSEFGFSQVTLLHTRDREQANDADFLKPLDEATVVWISGGNQSRLSNAYAGTRLEEKLLELRDNGVLIAGSSAGAAIQSKIMIEGGRAEPEMGTGFDLLPNAIIDQHFLRRSRLNRLIRAVEANPTRVGIGIDERTALVVKGNTATVLGDSYVVVVQMIDEKIDIQSFPSESTFRLDTMNLR